MCLFLVTALNKAVLPAVPPGSCSSWYSVWCCTSSSPTPHVPVAVGALSGAAAHPLLLLRLLFPLMFFSGAAAHPLPLSKFLFQLVLCLVLQLILPLPRVPVPTCTVSGAAPDPLPLHTLCCRWCSVGCCSTSSPTPQVPVLTDAVSVAAPHPLPLLRSIPAGAVSGAVASHGAAPAGSECLYRAPRVASPPLAGSAGLC